MKNKNFLYLNRVLAFIAFLCAFGRLCYELGSDKDINSFVMMLVFAIYYLLFLIISHRLVGAVIYTKKTYIIAAIISIGFIVLMWVLYLITLLCSNKPVIVIVSVIDIIYSCTITLISLAIGFIYLLLAFKFKDD